MITVILGTIHESSLLGCGVGLKNRVKVNVTHSTNTAQCTEFHIVSFNEIA